MRDAADHAAWREFDARYGELIVRFCRSHNLQLADAEDIRQAVMARLSRSLRLFRYDPARGRFRDYLGRIARNEMFRHLGRPGRDRTAVLDMDESAPSGGTERRRAPAGADSEREDRWDREWTHHHLRRAMRALRETFEPRSVEVFERLLGGESVAEVSQRFEMSPQAVHKVKQRVRDRLRALVTAQIREEDEGHGDAEQRRESSPD